MDMITVRNQTWYPISVRVSIDGEAIPHISPEFYPLAAGAEAQWNRHMRQVVYAARGNGARVDVYLGVPGNTVNIVN